MLIDNVQEELEEELEEDDLVEQKNIIDSFLNRNSYFSDEEEKNYQRNIHGTIINYDYESARLVILIDKLAKEIIKSKNIVFSIGRQPVSGNFGIVCKSNPLIPKEMQNISKALRVYTEINLNFPVYKYSPYVELYIKNLEELDRKLIHYRNFNLYSCSNERHYFYNEFVASIRKEANSKSFKIALNKYQLSTKKNYKGLLTYIDYLFNRYARLLVLRVDLSYGKGRCHLLSESEMDDRCEQIKRDFKRFLGNMRTNPIFKSMVGYVWKLEFGLDKGFHYHMIFFYDGSKEYKDFWKAKEIGEYWKNTITQGKGLYWNCNANKDKYKYLGIGMINYYDTVLKENLKRAAAYLTKPDLYAKINADKIGRTFGRKEIIVKKIPESCRRGRPRKKVDLAVI